MDGLSKHAEFWMRVTGSPAMYRDRSNSETTRPNGLSAYALSIPATASRLLHGRLCGSQMVAAGLSEKVM